MNSYLSQQGASSDVPSISDLDGYTFRDYNFPMSSSYMPADQDEFGFDPPHTRPASSKVDQNYSPPEQGDNVSLGGWPDFEREGDIKAGEAPSDISSHGLDKLIIQKLPGASTALSRFGQVTPPRSNSTSSTRDRVKSEEVISPKAALPDRRRRSKPQSKEEDAPASTKSGRKRKASSKIVAIAEQSDQPEDMKRKQSLEKNRVAAAKCRINKKEKIEILQRESHDKAVHNTFLKEQVLRMKEQVQQMNAILLSHANCDGCRSPEEIQQHLNHLGNDFFAHHMSLPESNYGAYPPVNMSDMSQMGPSQMLQDEYFSSPGHDQDSSMLHPPLPEFDRSAEFEVHTPMQTD